MSITRTFGGILIATLIALPAATLSVPADASPKACGQGVIANGKTNCKPSGLTSVAAAESRQQRFERGDRIPRTVIFQPISYVDYDLPRPEAGYTYITIGEDIYLVSETTRRVVMMMGGN